MSSDGLPKLGKIPQVGDLGPEEVTPLVLRLLELCQHQQEQIQQLRDEVARLKGEKARPQIKPSTLEKPPRGEKKRKRPKRRKISGSTRSDEGRRSRDTFASLKKTCRKQGLSFWDYLNDRVRGAWQIPSLAELIRERTSLGPPALTTSPLPSL